MRHGVGRWPRWVAVAVLSLLAGGYGGDRPGGTAAPDAPAAAAPAEDDGQPAALCEHGVPRDVCTKCNPDLAAAFKELGDWCDIHGLPKSQCRECDPSLDFTAKPEPVDWCREHAVPESMCTKCNPALVARFIAAGDYCREHGYPKSVCPRCNPELVTKRGEPLPTVPTPGTKVRLASDETAREAGIRTATVAERTVSDTIDVVGRLDFDQNRLAQLTSAVQATVVEVKADVGDTVRAGDPLVVLASAAVGEDRARRAAAEARVATATAALAREQSLLTKGISARRDVEQARSELAAARADLDGARTALSVAGAAGKASEGRYVLAAPFAGNVVARDVVAGKTVAPGEVLMRVADIGTMWALLEIPEAQATRVRAGQPITLTFEGVGEPPRHAVLGNVGASVDPATRTVRARVDLANADGALKAGLFVRARIGVSQPRGSTVVPREAVQYAEGQPLVFVKESETVYLPVPVKLGNEAPETIEILEGLEPGAAVVTTGAFLLKTEVLKDSIGAGCCAEGGE